MKPMEQMQMNSLAQDEIDVRRYADFLIEARSLIFKFALSAVLLGTVYALVAPPVYHSDMLFQIEEGAESSRSLLGDVSSAFDIKTGASTEIEILHSRLVVSKAVDALRLDIDAKPRYFPLIGVLAAKFNRTLSAPGLLGFGGFAWGSEHIDVSTFEVPQKLYDKALDLQFMGNGIYRLSSADGEPSFEGRVGISETFSFPDGPVTLNVSSIRAKPGVRFKLVRHPRLDTIERLQKKLQVLEKAKDSGVIQASLECTDSVLCGKILHTIGAAYLAQNVDRKTAEARRSLAFLNEQLPQLKAQLEGAEQKYTRFRDENGTIDLSAEGQSLLQQSSAAQTKLLELKVQRQDLLTRFSQSHPSVVAVNEQISELNDSIAAFSQQMKHFPDIEQEAVGLFF
ncbi:Wzz/FepE/Etk N-terminal domain-containing protein, partial [Trinickia dinghuensis]